MGNFVPFVAQNYACLYHRITAKDFVQTLDHDKAQSADKNHLTKIFQKNPFLVKGAILAWLRPKIMHLVSQNQL